MQMKIQIIQAHPAEHRSRINIKMVEAAKKNENVRILNLYNTYPDFEINVKAEQQRLEAADIIILQHPMYWYSCPSLLKEWIDLVLEYGWAYGINETALKGKYFGSAITTGGDQESYSPSGVNRYSIDEFIRPFEATANFCGMNWMKPFLVQGAHNLTEEIINEGATAYQQWLTDLSEGKI